MRDIIIIFLFSVPISLCPSHYLFTLVIEYGASRIYKLIAVLCVIGRFG
jgi:hypothetical protein